MSYSEVQLTHLRRKAEIFYGNHAHAAVQIVAQTEMSLQSDLVGIIAMHVPGNVEMEASAVEKDRLV